MRVERDDRGREERGEDFEEAIDRRHDAGEDRQRSRPQTDGARSENFVATAAENDSDAERERGVGEDRSRRTSRMANVRDRVDFGKDAVRIDAMMQNPFVDRVEHGEAS